MLLNVPLKGIVISSTELCSSGTTCRHFSLNASSYGLSFQSLSCFPSQTLSNCLQNVMISTDIGHLLESVITSETGVYRVSVSQCIQTPAIWTRTIFRYRPNNCSISYILMFMDAPLFWKLYSLVLSVRAWIISSDTNFQKYSSGVWRETASLVISWPEKSVLGLIKSFSASDTCHGTWSVFLNDLVLLAWCPHNHQMVIGFFGFRFQLTGISTFLFITCIRVHLKVSVPISHQ